MTAKTVGLGKLLKLLALPAPKLTSALRNELRQERKKLLGQSGRGGDFHVPFWADAKHHVLGVLDLSDQTDLRIESSDGRERLYPQLCAGFLDWLGELRRKTNQNVGWQEGSVHNHFSLPDLELTLKVDNLLFLLIGSDNQRLVYPYFSEFPILSEKWARVGLWLMSKALSDHSYTEMEILDVLRGRSFSGTNLFLQGDEEAVFATRYRQILTEWDALRPHYGLT